MANPNSFRISLVRDAVQGLDRQAAANLIRDTLAEGAPTGELWRPYIGLAGRIGEVSLALDAARRFALTKPLNLERVLSYSWELCKYGHVGAAIAELDAMPPEVQHHPLVLHLRGIIALQSGDLTKAQAHFRSALQSAPNAPQIWAALSTSKTFTMDDPDIARMEQVRPKMERVLPDLKAQFLYGLAKAYDDVGDQPSANVIYSEGAALMRRLQTFEREARQRTVSDIVSTYAETTIKTLHPSSCMSDRMIFVCGLPRSGTTLVEQILASHNSVHDGAEMNLMRAALIPAGNGSMQSALTYQDRSQDIVDPWGILAEDYLQMIKDRFGPEGRIVDKTLTHSHLTALIMHILPSARFIWLRRDPEDCALSCFKTFFSSFLPWSWGFDTTAAYFQMEDELYRYWSELYPERILTVQYEDLVSEPELWTHKLLAHVNLTAEPACFEPHKAGRVIRTASVSQVRAPISNARVGTAAGNEALMAPFRQAYFGSAQADGLTSDKACESAHAHL